MSAEAKQQLKELGHDGSVSIGVGTDSGGGQTYLKETAAKTGSITPSANQASASTTDLTLFINPALKIAPAPP